MRTRYPALLTDLALIVLFAIIGRSAHHEALSLAGIAQTAWPFVVGCLIGWVMFRTMVRRLRVWQAGLVIWFDTVLIGMLLRAVTDQGVHWSFIIVAAVTLLVFLEGWRLIWWMVKGRRLEAERRERRRLRTEAALAQDH